MDKCHKTSDYEFSLKKLLCNEYLTVYNNTPWFYRNLVRYSQIFTQKKFNLTIQYASTWAPLVRPNGKPAR
jgi:hypothetical protein